MEKFLLILALLGSAHLGLRSIADGAKHLFGIGHPKPDRQPDIEPTSGATATVIQEAPAKDWTLYDVPTFLRRGISLPPLNPVPSQATDASAPGGPTPTDAPSLPETGESAAFEIIA
jgi:hypothetical protein